MSWLLPSPFARLESVVDTSSTLLTKASAAASATVNTKGAWTEIVASTVRDVYLVTVMIGETHASGTDTRSLLDIGVGPAASEVVVIPDLLAGHVISSSPAESTFPVVIPAGSRIAIRAQSVVGSKAIPVGLQLYGGHALSTLPHVGPVTAYGVDMASSAGTVMPSPPSAHAKSGWSEIVASTARPIKGMVLRAQGAGSTVINRNLLTDIGVGAAGSEQIVLPNAFIDTRNNESIIGPIPNTTRLGLNIPAGSRLAVRIQSNGPTADAEVAIYGIG